MDAAGDAGEQKSEGQQVGTQSTDVDFLPLYPLLHPSSPAQHRAALEERLGERRPYLRTPLRDYHPTPEPLQGPGHRKCGARALRPSCRLAVNTQAQGPVCPRAECPRRVQAPALWEFKAGRVGVQ